MKRFDLNFWKAVSTKFSSVVIAGELDRVRQAVNEVDDVVNLCNSVDAIVDFEATGGEEFHVPVVNTFAKVRVKPQAVVVCSDRSESKLAEAAKNYYENDEIPVYRMYGDVYLSSLSGLSGIVNLDVTYQQSNLISAKPPCFAYAICSTQRTGSELLCELLSKTKRAGFPREHYDAVVSYCVEHGMFTLEHALARLVSRSSHDSGVFGTKLQWHILENVVSALRKNSQRSDLADLGLLQLHFPNLNKFIFLHRENIIKQAISLTKASQTGVFANINDHLNVPQQTASFDFQATYDNAKRILVWNEKWREFFLSNKIDPLEISYEELASNPSETCKRVLDYLGIDLPKNFVFGQPRHKKQGDQQNDEYFDLFVNTLLKRSVQCGMNTRSDGSWLRSIASGSKRWLRQWLNRT